MNTSQGDSSAQDSHEEVSNSIESDTSFEERTKRFLYLDTSVRLYQASLKGDWQVAKILIEKYPDLVPHPITETKERALHIAVAAEREAFVKELVKCMTLDDLALKNDNGNTALCFAAGESEIVSIAKEMVEVNKKLPLIRGTKGKNTPLYLAAVNGRRKMVSYLYPLTPFEHLTADERINILVATISTDMYDIALTILKKDRTLATTENSHKRIALQELARKPFAIGSRSQLSVWERCLNNSWFKGMYNKALMKTLAHELVELLWREVLLLPENKFKDLVDKHLTFLFKAAELGNVEYLIILIRSYPDLIWKQDKKNRSIFHIAVKHRQESVFNLIYEIGAIKGIVAKYTDETNNSILHLAGRLAPSERLNLISGAPLQMQRELLWFEEIKKIVPSPFKKMKNLKEKGKHVDACICRCLVNIDQQGQHGIEQQGQHGDKNRGGLVNIDQQGQQGIEQQGQHGDKNQDGFVNIDQQGQHGDKNQGREPEDAPWEVFIEEHKDLKEQGEKWMKDTANYYMLVATLIATVVFAAAFTVPGGNNQEIGTPIFLKNNWFMVFFISDSIAMLSSSTSILIFLSILTSRYAEKDFLELLPKRLLFGLTTLFISIASMVVAFSATCFLVYKSEMSWLPIIIIASASVPVTSFVVLHYQLWVDIFYSTCRSRFLFGNKHRLF